MSATAEQIDGFKETCMLMQQELEMQIELAEQERDLADAFAYEVMSEAQWERWLAGEESFILGT